VSYAIRNGHFGRGKVGEAFRAGDLGAGVGGAEGVTVTSALQKCLWLWLVLFVASARAFLSHHRYFGLDSSFVIFGFSVSVSEEFNFQTEIIANQQ
jgi:hypothetical protein